MQSVIDWTTGKDMLPTRWNQWFCKESEDQQRFKDDDT